MLDQGEKKKKEEEKSLSLTLLGRFQRLKKRRKHANSYHDFRNLRQPDNEDSIRGIENYIIGLQFGFF